MEFILNSKRETMDSLRAELFAMGQIQKPVSVTISSKKKGKYTQNFVANLDKILFSCLEKLNQMIIS